MMGRNVIKCIPKRSKLKNPSTEEKPEEDVVVLAEVKEVNEMQEN